MSLQFNDPNHVHAVSGTSTGEALTYDKAGNIAARAGGETYTFDAENRMTKTTSYPTSTDYKYDGQGNLAVRSTTATARRRRPHSVRRRHLPKSAASTASASTRRRP